MSELFFVVKTFIFSVIVVFLMQIKIGQSTIEQRSMKWIQESDVVESLQAVAEGAVLAASKGSKMVGDLISGKVSLSSSEKKTAQASASGGSWFKIKHKRGDSAKAEKSGKDETVEGPTGDEID